MRVRLPVVSSILLAILAAATPTSASTIVPAADPGQLAVDSEAVFLGRAGASRVVKRHRLIFTVTEIEVSRVIKGAPVPGERVEVSAPGGVIDGSGWVVSGSPRLAEGEVYLVFADRVPDASYRPRLLADSVLQRVIAEDGVALLVPMAEAAELSRYPTGSSGRSLVPGPVDAGAFVRALERRIAGKPGWDWGEMIVSTHGEISAVKSVPSGCSFMNLIGRNLRHTIFDEGGHLTIYTESSGEAGGGLSGDAEVERAISSWNNAGTNSLDLRFGGSRSYTLECVDPDGHDPLPNEPEAGENLVFFDDPCGDLPDLVNCSGTLAYSGPWPNGETHTFDGKTWFSVESLFVVVNDGAGCLGTTQYERLIAHGLGHGLGFDHVSDSDALMHEACEGGSCNDHNSTDIMCAEYAYPPAAAATATPTRTPTRTPTLTLTPTPTPGETTPTPTPTVTPTAPVSGPSKVTVPVIVHKTGSNQTLWRSDLVVTNPNGGEQDLHFKYTTASDGAFTASRSMEGYSSLLFEDLAASLFGAGISSGPLEIEVLTDDQEVPVVVSRAYAENTFGDLGSGLPADVEPSTRVVSMPGLYHDDDFRSSVSVTAGTDRNVWATFDLYRGDDGLVAGGVEEKILAGTQAQWSIQKLFRNFAHEGVPMTVRASLSNPGIVFASITDNDSTDSAVFLGKEPDTSWVVPVVAHIPGKDNTLWISSVSLWNSSDSEALVTLEYLPNRTNNSGGGIAADAFQLGPYSTVTIEDVANAVFGIDNGKGVLVVESTQPITVTSRVYTDCQSCPLGGTSGNGVRTLPVSSLSGGARVLPGVRLRGGFRTNIGVVTGDKGMTFEFDLRGSDGALLASTTLFVPPRTVHQRSVENLFGGGLAAPDPVGSIVVNGNKPYTAYLTVIDPSSQDPVFVMPR